MVFCKKCGFSVKEGAEVCQSCGADLRASAEPSKKVEVRVPDRTPRYEETRTNVCVKCGETLPENVAFCPRCGGRQDEAAKTEMVQPAENVCQNCGKPLGKGAAFCAYCGSRQGDTQRTEAVQTPKNVCINCGIQLTDGMTFCPHCGSRQGEDVSARAMSGTAPSYATPVNRERTDRADSISDKDILSSHYVKSFGFRRGTLIAQIIAIVLLLINSIIYFTVNAVADERGRIWLSPRKYMQFGDMGVIRLYMWTFLICAIICFMKCIPIYSQRLNVMSKGISGVAGAYFYFKTENVSISYAEIINVRVKWNKHCIVDTTLKSYSFMIKDPSIARRMIMDMKSKNE